MGCTMNKNGNENVQYRHSPMFCHVGTTHRDDVKLSNFDLWPRIKLMSTQKNKRTTSTIEKDEGRHRQK